MESFIVYDHPSDFPNDYVVRRWIVKNGNLEPQEIVLKTNDLKEVRKAMEEKKLYCLTRLKFDDPKILETWIQHAS